MPRRRRQPRRRRPAQSGYLDTASKALAVAYAVKKLINVEYKTLSTAFTADPNNAGAVVNLTAIAQGDGVGARSGNKCRVKYISVKGTVFLHASATQSRVRMMIVRDNNGSTTQPAITDLFADATTFAQNKNKLGDPQSNSRFSVLFDKMLMIDTRRPQYSYAWSQALDHHVFFSGSGATDEGKGHLYLFIASNEATNDPIITADAMVKWIDN